MLSKRVLVLCGGRSAERDVSCVSAAALLRHLPKKYRPVLVRIDLQGRWHLQRSIKAFASSRRPERFRFERFPVDLVPGPGLALRFGSRRIKIDIAFPALHGPFGEDGTLQGLLEIFNVPYVGSGVLGSAVSMDKEVTKRLGAQVPLPQLPYAVVGSVRELGKARHLKYPVFVKPLRLGSSVGVAKVYRRGELAGAVRRALRFDASVIIEQGIRAREIECAVLGGPGNLRASIPGEIQPNADFYSYEAKYLDPQGAALIIPARLSAAQRKEVQRMALAAFQALGCYGLARVDFLMDARSGKIWFNEVNTLPGFTAISMYPKLWEASGVSFSKLVDRLLTLAVSRHKKRSSLRLTRD